MSYPQADIYDAFATDDPNPTLRASLITVMTAVNMIGHPAPDEAQR